MARTPARSVCRPRPHRRIPLCPVPLCPLRLPPMRSVPGSSPRGRFLHRLPRRPAGCTLRHPTRAWRAASRPVRPCLRDSLLYPTGNGPRRRCRTVRHQCRTVLRPRRMVLRLRRLVLRLRRLGRRPHHMVLHTRRTLCRPCRPCRTVLPPDRPRAEAAGNCPVWHHPPWPQVRPRSGPPSPRGRARSRLIRPDASLPTVRARRPGESPASVRPRACRLVGRGRVEQGTSPAGPAASLRQTSPRRNAASRPWCWPGWARR